MHEQLYRKQLRNCAAKKFQRLLCDLQNVVLIFTINSIRAEQLVQHYERHVNLIRKFFGRHDTPSAVVN